MNLDFSMLPEVTLDTTARNPWGQVGTPGTPALMRSPRPLHAGDRLGTAGDTARALARNSAPNASADRLPAARPQMYPTCPLAPTTRNLNEINVSPLSPLVPAEFGASAAGRQLDLEAFEERAAIMEFDGGLTRAEAEKEARRLVWP